MPPKNKKEVHNTPKRHPRDIRNREQAVKADQKKLKRASTRFEKERMQNRAAAASATDDTGHQESSQHEARGAEGGLEQDINLPHSSGSISSTSRTQECEETNSTPLHSSIKNAITSPDFDSILTTIEQQLNFKQDSEKEEKNANLPNTSPNKPSTSSIIGPQVINQKGDSAKKGKNTNQPNTSSKKPSTSSTIGQQETQQSDSGEEKNNTNQPNTSSKKPSTSSTIGQQETQQSDSGEEKNNTNQPNTSSKKPSTSSTRGQQEIQENDSGKGKENTNQKNTFSKKSRTSGTIVQQAVRKNDRGKLRKNTNQPKASSNKPSKSSTLGQQVNSKSEHSKARKKTGNVFTPTEENLLNKPKSSDLNIRKNVEDKKSDNIAATEVDNPLTNTGNKNLPKSDQVKMQIDENKDVFEIELGKSKDLAFSTSSIVASTVHRKSTEDDLTDKRKILEEKLKASETAMKSLDELEEHLASVKEKEMAVIGDIKPLSKEESVKIGDNKSAEIAYYDPSKRMVFLGDKNVKISIQVNQGNQVVCNVRNRQERDLFQNVASGSDILESHVLTKTDDKAKTEKSEEYDKTISDTKLESMPVGEFSDAYFQAVDDQTAGNSNTDTLITSEERTETSEETETTTRQAKLKKLSRDYLKNVKLVAETFERRFKNYIMTNL